MAAGFQAQASLEDEADVRTTSIAYCGATACFSTSEGVFEVCYQENHGLPPVRSIYSRSCYWYSTCLSLVRATTFGQAVEQRMISRAKQLSKLKRTISPPLTVRETQRLAHQYRFSNSRAQGETKQEPQSRTVVVKPSSILVPATFRPIITWDANRNEHSDSWYDWSVGLRLTIINVFPSPDSAGCSRYVSLEFLKGICHTHDKEQNKEGSGSFRWVWGYFSEVREGVQKAVRETGQSDRRG